MKMSIYEYRWLIIGLILLIGSQIIVSNYCNIDDDSMIIGVIIGLISMMLIDIGFYEG